MDLRRRVALRRRTWAEESSKPKLPPQARALRGGPLLRVTKQSPWRTPKSDLLLKGISSASARPLTGRRDHVERPREDRVDEDEQRADEPCRSPAARDEARRHGRDHHHRHRARPELQAHRQRSDDIAEQHSAGAMHTAIWEALPTA